MDPPITTLMLFQIEQEIFECRERKAPAKANLDYLLGAHASCRGGGFGKADTRAPGQHLCSGIKEEGSYLRA